MPIAPPPDPFPSFNTAILEAGVRVVRIHDPAFDGAAFNPCRGGPSRFAPLYDALGQCVPTMYAAGSFKASVRESVFHNVPYDRENRSVRLGAALPLAVTELELTQDLTLARLHENDLNRLGTTRSQLIDTLPDTYTETVRWAGAFHAADPPISGLVWSSRRSEPEQAYVFFGNRVSASAWTVVSTEHFSRSAARLAELAAVASEDGILLVL